MGGSSMYEGGVQIRCQARIEDNGDFRLAVLMQNGCMMLPVCQSVRFSSTKRQAQSKFSLVLDVTWVAFSL